MGTVSGVTGRLVMDLAEMAAEYREKYQPKYSAYAERVKLLLQDLITPTGVKVALFESRAKSVGSFKEKVVRKKYRFPFRDIKDFAGVRVVTYYRDDVARVAKIISTEFEVSEPDSGSKADMLDVNQFGYRSLHFVCRMNGGRCERGEWKQYANLCVEIQVCSVAEHAWAALSHELDYKSAAAAPEGIRRRLYAVSALFELADNEFDSIRGESEKLKKTYGRAISKGDLSHEINSESLAILFGKRGDLEGWAEIGRSSGLPKVKSNWGDFEGTISFLVEIFRGMDCGTLQDVEDLLFELKEKASQALKKVIAVSQRNDCLVYAYSLDVIMFVALVVKGRVLPPGFKFPAAWGEREGRMLQELAEGTA
ncbi:GTP pyrophosphokinase family protein [Streptomyces netropsis]|uniref:GTP pyrophosphokinase family protein n=1 Tax=Streptomyces netropsis TaxID=55404 RepID=UPI00379B5CDF